MEQEIARGDASRFLGNLLFVSAIQNIKYFCKMVKLRPILT